MKCPICGNNKSMRTVPSNRTGALGKPLITKQVYCPYCEWKGTTGLGKVLRETIKQINSTR